MCNNQGKQIVMCVDVINEEVVSLGLRCMAPKHGLRYVTKHKVG